MQDHVAMNEKSFNYHVVCHHLFIKKKSLVDSNVLTFFSNIVDLTWIVIVSMASDPLIMISKM